MSEQPEFRREEPANNRGRNSVKYARHTAAALKTPGVWLAADYGDTRSKVANAANSIRKRHPGMEVSTRKNKDGTTTMFLRYTPPAKESDRERP